MNTLLVFAKEPILGKVKTRVAAMSSPEFALRLYQRLLKDTLDVCRNIPADRMLFIDGFSTHKKHWTHGFKVFSQEGSDLGQKMTKAFTLAFKSGQKKVVIIGTDCPDIKEDHIELAFRQLCEHDVVIGPAKDGGYYLLGFKEMHQELFLDIPWSTSGVLSKTMKRINQMNLSFSILPVLSDVDELKDVPFPLLKEL